MTLTAQQTKLDELYKKNFGETRGASFGTTGGADYWLDTHNPQTEDDWKEIDRMLAGSDEGVKYAASVAAGNPTVLPGGIDPTKSISSQAGPGTWASHFLEGGAFENMNAAAKITDIANDIGFTPSEAYFNNSVGEDTGGGDTGGEDTGGGDTGGGDTGGGDTGSTNWWDQFDDIDAFKDALGLGTQQQSGGMDDFMKFMMFMSMMRPQGGGGYGGSQYGYGGLNPGGVMSAYNPMDNIQSAISAFQSIPGIGGGSGLNDGNAAAA